MSSYRHSPPRSSSLNRSDLMTSSPRRASVASLEGVGATGGAGGNAYSNGLGAVQLELYQERSERRKLDEEANRLRLALSEIRGVNTANESALVAARREGAEMEQLFLEQRRRNADLEASLKRNEVAALEAETLRQHLADCRQQLLAKERELFEDELNRSVEEQAIRSQIRSSAMGEMHFAKMAHTVEVAEAERRLALVADAVHGLMDILRVAAARVGKSLSDAMQRAVEGDNATTSLKSSQAAVLRLTEANRQQEQHTNRIVGELRALVAKADERSADALKAVQTERDANYTLREELKDARERIKELLLIPEAPHSSHPHPHLPAASSSTASGISVRSTSPPRRESSVFYVPANTSIFSPIRADTAEVEALRRQSRLLGGEALDVLRDKALRVTVAEEEAAALRARVKVLEAERVREATYATNAGSLSAAAMGLELSQLRKDAREMSEVLAQRQQQLVILAQRASVAEKETTQYKELTAALQQRLQMMQQTADTSRATRHEQDAVVEDLTRQVKSLSQQLRDARDNAAAMAAVVPSAGGSSSSSSAAALQSANRRLELVISEMSDIKAENVTLRAQLLSASVPLLSATADAIARSDIRTSPPRTRSYSVATGRDLSPLRDRSGAAASGRDVSPIRGDLGLSYNSHASAVRGLRTPPSRHDPHPSVAVAAGAGPAMPPSVLSPWRAADARLADEIKGLAQRNAYLEAVLQGQSDAKRSRLDEVTSMARALRSASGSPQRAQQQQQRSEPFHKLHEPSKAANGITLRMGNERSPSRPRHQNASTASAGVGGATPRPAPTFGSAQNSPSRSFGNGASASCRLNTTGAMWTPDAPVATATARRRREQPGGNHFDASLSLPDSATK